MDLKRGHVGMDKKLIRKIAAKHLGLMRNELDLKQADISDKTGLDESQYGKYEQGDRLPDLFTLIRLHKVISIDEWIRRTVEDYQTQEDDVFK